MGQNQPNLPSIDCLAAFAGEMSELSSCVSRTKALRVLQQTCNNLTCLAAVMHPRKIARESQGK